MSITAAEVKAAAKDAAPSAQEIEVSALGSFWAVVLKKDDGHKITTFTVEQSAPADFLSMAAENAARGFES